MQKQWRKIMLLWACLFLVWQGEATAEEGMFLLYETNKLPVAALQKKGLRLSVKELQSLAPAIVQLARGGTGSFVSQDGLIVTNHHVAYGCLARLDATTHKGVMSNGYVAASRDKELHCPGYDMMVVVRLEDVTQQVLSVVKKEMTPTDRAKAIRTQRRTLEAACEKGTGLICEVSPLNGGAGFTLSAYERLLDVRLVYAPTGSLGKFGGDIDNWRYPRHTADFTFLRAYAGKDGRSAKFSATNQPFRPKRFLKISTQGIQRGDLAMVMGFPGRTSRHTSYAQAVYYYERAISQRAELFRALLAILPEKGLGKRRYQGLSASLNNSAKYYEDLKTQFEQFKVLERKKKASLALQAKIDADPKLKAKHGDLLGQITKILDGYRKIDKKDLHLLYMQSRLLRSFATAADIVRWSKVRKMPDIERPGERYREKNIYAVHRDAKMLEQMVTRDGERRIATAFFQRAYALPESQRPQVAVWLHQQGVEEIKRLRPQIKALSAPFASIVRVAMKKLDPIEVAIASIYARTRLLGHEKNPTSVKAAYTLRKALLKAEEAEIRSFQDPLLQLVIRIVDEQAALRKTALVPMEKLLAPILIPRLVSQLIQPNYWDANFTLRVTYGSVQDYTEAKTKKTFFYLTTLAQLLAKETGKDPFEIPDALKKAAKAKDFGRWIDAAIKDIPINFTATLDTTGGNSGSPVINGAGEVIGLLFDGTPEAILSDWQYVEAEQRSICVDIRFVLFLAEKVDGAKALLAELGLAEAPKAPVAPPKETAPAPKKAPAPPATPATPTAAPKQGSLPKEAIRNVIRAAQPQIRFCYEEELKKAPKLAGRFTARFVIDEKGVAQEISFSKDTLQQPAVTACITKVLSSLRFPAPSGGSVSVRYPFSFSPSPSPRR